MDTYLLYPLSTKSKSLLKPQKKKERVGEMKSIVFFFLLLLFAVATSENVINGWYNLTGVHEDEMIWGSQLAPMMKDQNTIGYHSLQRGVTCAPECIGDVKYGNKPRICSIYDRCKRGVSNR